MTDRQCQKKESEGPAVVRPEQGVEDGDVGESVGEDEENIESAKWAADKCAHGGKNSEEKENECGEQERAAEEARGNVELVIPLPEIEISTTEGQGKQDLPVFAPTYEEGGGAKH